MRNQPHPWNLSRIFGRQFVVCVGSPSRPEARIAARVIPAQSSRRTFRGPSDADLATWRLGDLATWRLQRDCRRSVCSGQAEQRLPFQMASMALAKTPQSKFWWNLVRQGQTYDAKGSCYNRIAKTVDQVLELVCNLRRVGSTNRWHGKIDRNSTICSISLKTQQYYYINLQQVLVMGCIQFGNQYRRSDFVESIVTFKKY